MSIPVIIYTAINHGIAITKLAKSLAVAWGAFWRGFHFIGDADAAIARALCASDALTCDVDDRAIFDAFAIFADGFSGWAVFVLSAFWLWRIALARRIVGIAFSFAEDV